MPTAKINTLRKCLPLAALLIVVILAWMLSAKAGGWLLAPVQWLGQYEGFHLIGHWVIFGGIAWLTRSQNRVRRWGYVLVGGIALEVAQAIGSGAPLSAAMLRASLFDLGMDVLGALAVPPFFRAILNGKRLIFPGQAAGKKPGQESR